MYQLQIIKMVILIFLLAEEEKYSLQLIEAGIVKRLFSIQRNELQQQALDLIILMLGKGR